jgi:hypothetical protein
MPWSVIKPTQRLEDIGSGGDPLLGYRWRGVCHLPLLFRVGFTEGMRMKKEGLCTSKEEGK